jgi:hypothetical protein
MSYIVSLYDTPTSHAAVVNIQPVTAPSPNENRHDDTWEWLKWLSLSHTLLYCKALSTVLRPLGIVMSKQLSNRPIKSLGNNISIITANWKFAFPHVMLIPLRRYFKGPKTFDFWFFFTKKSFYLIKEVKLYTNKKIDQKVEPPNSRTLLLS